MDVLIIESPYTEPDDVITMAAGTSSADGAGSFVATKDRAAGRDYVVITVEQHTKGFVSALIDIVEVRPARNRSCLRGCRSHQA